MINRKREFGVGVTLLVVFFGGLALVFSPLFGDGKNALDYLDGVFNSISKASAYYIPASIERARTVEGAAVSVKMKAIDPEQARQVEKLFASAGATVAVDGSKLVASGDLGRILGIALADADAMFKNDEAAVARRVGFDGRRALYAWHTALSDAMKDLTRQGKFKEAATVRDALTRALEPAYNYHGVTAVSMKHMAGTALAALIGYVIYTIWYGFAILFLFEGSGLKLEH